MCDCDILSPDVYGEKQVRSRKKHNCYECRVPIQKGDRYYKISGCWDGSWNNYKICQDCYDLGKYLQDKEDCFCWEFGNLFQEIRDGHLFENEYILSCNYDGKNLIKVDESISENSSEYDEDKHELYNADVYRLIPF